MGWIITVREGLGIGGTDDGGTGSALRNIGQIGLFGAVVREEPADAFSNVESIELDPAALPWELRDPS